MLCGMQGFSCLTKLNPCTLQWKHGVLGHGTECQEVPDFPTSESQNIWGENGKNELVQSKIISLVIRWLYVLQIFVKIVIFLISQLWTKIVTQKSFERLELQQNFVINY